MIIRTLLAGAAALALTSCTATQNSMPSGPEPVLTAEAMNDAFEQIGANYLEVMAELNPVYATQLGNHAYDGELPDISAQGRAEQLRTNQAYLISLKQIDFAQLTPQNQVDYRLLENQLNYSIWSTETLQDWAWDPQMYSSLASGSLYSLTARDFAPWPQRFQSIVERMEKLPAFLAEARQQIDVARVPEVHAQTVAAQNAGIMQIVEASLLPEVESSGVDRSRFDAAMIGLKAAVAEHQTWLDEVLVPGAKGDFRLGTELYDAKMRFALVSDITRPELKARAEAAFDETRQQMYEIGLTFSDCTNGLAAVSRPSDQQDVIQCALEKTYAVRPSRENLEQVARDALVEATEFAAAQDFVRMPEGAVQIIPMPKAFQGFSVAYLDAPGPLDRSLPAFYAISPVPDEWSEEQATSFLSEYNNSMLQLLSIHEGVPGHYLQLDHANKYEGTLRAVLSSGPFIEGWAVYSERVMAEADYLGGMETEQGKLFILSGLKFRLRAIANTLLDIGLHTENMQRDEAMALMMEGSFQQEREAAGKWVRANLSSAQLLSYFTGYTEHLALRREAEERWGAEFNMREYHDALLANGSPPVKYARALLFDLPVE